MSDRGANSPTPESRGTVNIPDIEAVARGEFEGAPSVFELGAWIATMGVTERQLWGFPFWLVELRLEDHSGVHRTKVGAAHLLYSVVQDTMHHHTNWIEGDQ